MILFLCSYDGFPVLDHKLFLNPTTEQPTSPNGNNTKNDSSSLITVRSTAEKTKGKQAAEYAHEDPELWAKYVCLLHIGLVKKIKAS